MPGIPKAQRNAETRRNAAVVAAANANPDTRCTICGKTLAEAQAAGMAHPEWDYGHAEPGIPAGAQHASCNRSHGAAKGNRWRGTGYDWPR